VVILEGTDGTTGIGSLDEEREDTIDPGVESLELRLVLLCGRSGYGLLLFNGVITPNGRFEALATGRRFILVPQ